MTQHTQGPWHTAGDQGVQIRSEKHQIAKVWCMRGNEFKANAQLIAAAPELLAALERMIDSMERLRLSGDAGNWEWEDGDEYMQAVAAVQKAKGENHG